MNEKTMLLKRIQACDFALYDTALFLNNNPKNQQALAYYRKHQAIRKEAASRYTQKYGPLTHKDYDGGPKWTWATTPWPWQTPEEVYNHVDL